MSGFKNFVLRGNLVDVAVAFIIGVSFGTVVTTFTNWLTSLMPDSASDVFSNEPNSFGAFLNAVIAFLILAAVVYFFVVVPYTKAKERFFPTSEVEGTPEDVALLTEIRDLLAARNSAP
jgi:large conductance mechanosensitive channel